MNDFVEMWKGDWNAVDWASVTWRVVAVIVLWILIWLSRRYADRLLRLFLAHNKHIGPKDTGILRRFLGYLSIFVGVIVTLALLEMNPLLHSALTAAGVLGIAIGLAVRDVVANFIAGIFIFTDRLFTIGDVVKIGEHIGTVKDVSLRTTTLTALDGPVVTIPNAALTTSPLINFSAAPERRLTLTMSIIGEGDIGAALSILEEVVHSEERVIQDDPPAAYVTAVREYMVDLQIACRVKPADLAVVHSDLQRRVVEQFRARGIRLAMPVRLNLSTDG